MLNVLKLVGMLRHHEVVSDMLQDQFDEMEELSVEDLAINDEFSVVCADHIPDPFGYELWNLLPIDQCSDLFLLLISFAFSSDRWCWFCHFNIRFRFGRSCGCCDSWLRIFWLNFSRI